MRSEDATINGKLALIDNFHSSTRNHKFPGNATYQQVGEKEFNIMPDKSLVPEIIRSILKLMFPFGEPYMLVGTEDSGQGEGGGIHMHGPYNCMQFDEAQGEGV